MRINNMTINKNTLLLLLGFFILSMPGCGGMGDGKVAPLVSVDGDYPTRHGETTPSGVELGGYLRLNETADARSLDPVRTGETSAHHIGMQIYDSVLQFDNDMNLDPCLAESYELSEDGKIYTLQVRKGVHFHDDPCFPNGKGRELTAHDLKYSLSRNLDPTTQSTGAFLFEGIVEGAQAYMRGEAEEVTGFQVVDDFTFQIRLTKPFSPFPYRLAMSYCFICPKEAVEHYGEDFFQNPVGTGPFRFVHWKPGQDLLMVRNTKYWKKDRDGVQLPYLDGVRFTFLNDFKTELLSLDLGELDMITTIHEDLWSRVFDKESNLKPNYQHYQLQAKSLLDVHYFGFNMEKPPFKGNKALRQAINYAVNREAIIEYVLQGRGTRAKGIVPIGMPGYKPTVEGYKYNPEKASQLLREAGYPNGEGLPVITLDLNSGGTTNEAIAEAIQNQLDQVGIKVRLNIVEWVQHLENIDNGASEFFRLGWIADYPDPENFLSLFWSKNIPPIGPNYTRYRNEEFDRLFEKALTIADQEERFAIYQQIEKMAVEDASMLFLYYRKRHRLLQPFVKNLELNVQENPILEQTWLDFPEKKPQT